MLLVVRTEQIQRFGQLSGVCKVSPIPLYFSAINKQTAVHGRWVFLKSQKVELQGILSKDFIQPTFIGPIRIDRLDSVLFTSQCDQVAQMEWF